MSAGMSRAEALAEARRRWGKDARVWRVRDLINEDGPMICRVGAMRCLGRDRYAYRLYEGQGPSWEAAFADAGRRAAERGSK